MINLTKIFSLFLISKLLKSCSPQILEEEAEIIQIATEISDEFGKRKVEPYIKEHDHILKTTRSY